tara:strand:- start:1123 stop:1422 length:300 start_codon:yes stop_codon:yes gene_type:complete
MHIGVVRSISEHPINALLSYGFCTTINTDNRLMSRTSLTEEIQKCGLSFGWDLNTLHTLMGNALFASFISEEQKEDLNTRLSEWYLSYSKDRKENREHH